MHELNLDELSALLAVFARAGVQDGGDTEGQLLARIRQLHAEREEMESMDFDDCLGGACKL
ncbi:hypothetical protein GCM10011352_27540 [Marinobacterium zhoushanense]|uniref:Uncharacterized protein n=1 Tax=Marinobacterium zhoushanense TaxID=1679163 RepID=A0ABQ1KN25_9GAMM|nr:hypothetical protein [Marinobacterium zhoushanense]GGB99803.1 hypothetical protein GCM10011352_27540 [Marinobacterium zhoushanense]